MTTFQVCDSCESRPSGHGHFGSYCEPCSELPYGQSAPRPEVDCQTEGCGQVHEATYSHEGRFGEGHVYAVVCGDLVDYYTDEVVR